jgi:hypothetical protein
MMFKSRSLRWAGPIAIMEEGKCGFKILTGNAIGKGPLGPWNRWEDNIRMDIKEMRVKREIGLIRLRIGTIGGPF